MVDGPKTRNDTGEAENEPVITGTLLLTTLLLIMIVGFWVLMYMTLLER